MAPRERSDEELLAGVASGDEGAAHALVRRYERRVFGIALAILADSHAAEDAAQVAFERVCRHAADFDARRARASTWILAIARNCAVDVRRSRRLPPADPDTCAWELADAGSDPLQRAIARDSLRELGAAIAALPPEQRRALTLAALSGCSAREVAEREGIPLGTAKTRLRSALARLRSALSEVELASADGHPSQEQDPRQRSAQARASAPRAGGVA
jgi:RNA polymerase sigma factor (sigma-70 family)